VAIFNKLRMPDVVGQPPMATAAGDWVRDIIRAVFGSIDEADGRRHVAEVFGLVPKKNAKTTNGAGIMMTALLETSGRGPNSCWSARRRRSPTSPSSRPPA
jgi:phage terminase large subunit-like protein